MEFELSDKEKKKKKRAEGAIELQEIVTGTLEVLGAMGAVTSISNYPFWSC